MTEQNLTGKIMFNQGNAAGQSQSFGGQPQQVNQTAQPQAANTPAPAGTQEQGQAPQYLTVAEFEQAKRQLQSMIDSQISQVDKRVAGAVESVQSMVAMAEKSGVKFTDDQIFQMKQTAINDAMVQSTQPQGNTVTPTVPAQPNPAQGLASVGQTDPAKWAEGMFLAAGVPADSDSLKLVNQHTDDVGLFKQSVITAIADFHQRANQQALPPNPASVPGAALHGAGSTSNLQSAYVQEMLAARGQGKHVGREIRAKYRNLGLDVDTIGFQVK